MFVRQAGVRHEIDQEDLQIIKGYNVLFMNFIRKIKKLLSININDTLIIAYVHIHICINKKRLLRYVVIRIPSSGRLHVAQLLRRPGPVLVFQEVDVRCRSSVFG